MTDYQNAVNRLRAAIDCDEAYLIAIEDVRAAIAELDRERRMTMALREQRNRACDLALALWSPTWSTETVRDLIVALREEP